MAADTTSNNFLKKKKGIKTMGLTQEKVHITSCFINRSVPNPKNLSLQRKKRELSQTEHTEEGKDTLVTEDVLGHV